MSDALKNFFAAWAEPDADKRNSMIDAAVDPAILYADPRTEAPLTDLAALKDYVAMFSQMAPGMPVACVNVSNTLHFARATVHFGEGDKAQTGQYIADLDAGGKITRLIGFVGMGEPQA
ncbi:nuclear transport factor 2 family protein [Yoonia sp. 208BN28-4]|uniref:nuclear transport factor 2 family protein n=1 Tax=Yoonia sp. 208BN28-4 TaxID=3126505 RepID=UPI0030AA90B0